MTEFVLVKNLFIIFLRKRRFESFIKLLIVDTYQMGKLKSRIRPSDITINIGKDASIPECPIPGERC